MLSIRVHSVYKNTLTNTHLSGHVVFALTSEHLLSKVKLSLQGIHQVHFVESFQTKDGKTIGTAPFDNDEVVITVSWPNLLVNENGSIGHFTDTNSQLFNLLPTTTFDYENIPTGTTPFPNEPNQVYRLPPGNYALPFKFTLPDNIPDTITTSHSTIKYKFYASIETIDNVGNVKASKPLSVFRTPPPQNPSIYVSENAWTGKVQYKISVNNQLPSIASTMDISLIFIPLIKRLSLGKIRTEIHRIVKIYTNRSNSFDENTFKFEKLVYATSLPALPQQQLPNDSWNLKAKIPLDRFVQNMSAKQMSVTYKLILIIDLINPDGHISQIKSKIPLAFYVNPEQMQRNDDLSQESNLLIPELLLLPPDDDTPLNVSNPITPPSYIQSKNDILYTPITTPLTTPLGSETNLLQLANLPNSRSRSNSKPSPFPLRNQSTPDYRKVYDDDLDQIGEPTPIYQESANSYSLPVTRSTSPIVQRSLQNNTPQHTSSNLALSSLSLSGSLSRRVLSLNSNLNRLADVQ